MSGHETTDAEIDAGLLDDRSTPAMREGDGSTEARKQLSAARQRLIAAERDVDGAVRAVVAERVRQTYPGAHTLIAEGEWNEDGLLHLHTQKILDAEGNMLDGYDEDGVSTSGDFDELTDEIDSMLDEIAERDESYQGTQEIDLT